jgi:hypothetical protein
MAPQHPHSGAGHAHDQNSQAGQVTYTGDNEAQLRAEWEQQATNNPGFFGTFKTFAEYVKYKSDAAKFQADQAKKLKEQVEDYRPPVQFDGNNYMSWDHPALKAMITDNMDPNTADQQGRAWTKIGNTLANLQSGLQKATDASQDAWQGVAADSARNYFAGVATWSGNAAQAAQLTGNSMAQQQEAASTAKSAMPEPVNYNTSDALKDFFSAPPWQWASKADEIQQKFDEKQQAHEQAAQVMTTMAQSFQQSGSTMPAFAAPPTMDGSSGDGRIDTPEQVTPPEHQSPNFPGGNGNGNGNVGQSNYSGGNTTQSGVGTVPGGGGGFTPGPGGGELPGGGTNPSAGGFVPPVGGGFPPGAGGTTRPSAPGARPSFGPGGRSGATGGRSGGAGGLGGGAARGAGGGAGGMGGAGRGSGSFGPGGAAAAGKGFGPGGSGTAGSASGVMAGEQAGRTGGFGPGGAGPGGAGRGGAGAGGMGMGAGGAKGQGDEDKEHKSASYLVETEDVFGDGTMVAPPVIGG